MLILYSTNAQKKRHNQNNNKQNAIIHLQKNARYHGLPSVAFHDTGHLLAGILLFMIHFFRQLPDIFCSGALLITAFLMRFTYFQENLRFLFHVLMFLPSKNCQNCSESKDCSNGRCCYIRVITSSNGTSGSCAGRALYGASA